MIKRKKATDMFPMILGLIVSFILTNGVFIVSEDISLAKDAKEILTTLDGFNETVDLPTSRPTYPSQQSQKSRDHKPHRSLSALSDQDDNSRNERNAQPRRVFVNGNADVEVKNRFPVKVQQDGAANFNEENIPRQPAAAPADLVDYEKRPPRNRDAPVEKVADLPARPEAQNKMGGWQGGEQNNVNQWQGVNQGRNQAGNQAGNIYSGGKLDFDSNRRVRDDENNNRFQGNNKYAGQSENRLNSSKKVTVKPRVSQSAKSDVRWFDDTQYYGLRASADERFKIRSAPPPLQGSPWPMPRLYQPANVTFRIDAQAFELHVVGEPCDELIEINFKTRILPNTFNIVPPNDDDLGGKAGGVRHEGEELRRMAKRFHGGPDDSWSGGADGWNGGDIHMMNVTVLKECSKYPHLEMDESYDLEVKRSGVSIITREIWGALRAMETFSQLVYQDEHGQFLINKTYIHDYPRFKHRGILLDTSRHFINKRTLLANLEAMAQNKMNVFHWHIVDDQSFPFQSKTFPDLTKLGSYDAHTHVYTHEDIAEIIEEARIRGIRVIPEFDSPGHTFSWGYGQDHLLTPCYNYKREPSGLYGPINPILKKTYKFLRGLFDEVLTVFKDRYIHLGGDEVPFDCWQSNPYLQNFMMRNNLSDIKDLLSLYGKELMKILMEVGSKRNSEVGFIAWQEMFDNGVKMKPDTIIQIWSGDSFDIDRVTRSGLRAIFSTCWYLDYINYGQDWDKYYRCEQIGSQLDEYRVHNLSLLIGGEACLWTEYADDANIMSRLWPRASAAAERLWSDKSLDDVHQAAPRIEEQRCRMIRRGLQVGVLSGPGYCKHFIKPSASGRENEPVKERVERDVLSFSKVDHLFGVGRLRGVGEKKESERGGVRGRGGERPQDYLRVKYESMSKSDFIPSVVLALFSIAVVALLLVLLCRDGVRHRCLSLIHMRSTSQRRLILLFTVFVVAWGLWSVPFWFHSAGQVLAGSRSHQDLEGWA